MKHVCVCVHIRGHRDFHMVMHLICAQRYAIFRLLFNSRHLGAPCFAESHNEGEQRLFFALQSSCYGSVHSAQAVPHETQLLLTRKRLREDEAASPQGIHASSLPGHHVRSLRAHVRHGIYEGSIPHVRVHADYEHGGNSYPVILLQDELIAIQL